MAKFKQEVIELIESDAELFVQLCKALDIKPSSMPVTLKRNGKLLNQYHIVTLVANHLGKEADELVEEELMGEQS